MQSEAMYKFFRPFFKVALRMKYKVVIVGREHIPNKGPVILAANHLRMADSPLIAAFATSRPVYFAAKIEYFRDYGKIVAWFFRTTGMIPVDRQSRTALRDLDSAAKILLEKGKVFAIHPEGTRSKTGKIARFRVGVTMIALSTKSQIIPVGVKYRKRGFLLRDKVVITVREPLSWAEYARVSVKEATDSLRHKVREVSGQELE